MSHLSKTAYLAYRHCPKHLWLSQHRPHLATPPDDTAQRRLRMGQAVDQHARQQFPDGHHIPYRPDPHEMAQLTTQAITDGITTLFQATFAPDDLLVKVDILTQTATGWHLIEVKSSTSYNRTRTQQDHLRDHLNDVAFQVYTAQQAELNITQASLLLLNKTYLHPDPANLFTLHDLTAEVEALLPQVAADVPIMRDLLNAEDTPQAHIGRHCNHSTHGTCPFYAHCWQGITNPTIYDIPRLSRDKEQPLEKAGILYLTDIPATHPFTPTQRQYIELFTQAQISIDRAAIQQALAQLEYPLYFFDFETIDHAVPIYDGCKPYQQFPFQYSCHILHADGTLTHREYLHTGTDDPRPALVEALLTDLGDSGHIVAYYAQFEGDRLRELAAAFPEYEADLLALTERLWDQLDIFKKHYADYRFGGSNSLKSVLPVLVPDLSYKALAVQNGTQAQVVWEEMVAAQDVARQQGLVAALLAYCHLDTLAMVEIHRVLTSL
jgi:hypothetical protein